MPVGHEDSLIERGLSTSSGLSGVIQIDEIRVRWSERAEGGWRGRSFNRAALDFIAHQQV